jgi:hypothetical protein
MFVETSVAAATIDTMRRLLIILLLTLLPIQASWAAVCAYCPDNCISESATVAAGDETSADTGTADDNDDCSRCQLGGVGIPTCVAAARYAPPPASLGLPDAGALLDSSTAHRPERPKWMRAA